MPLPTFECVAPMFGITIISMINILFWLVWFLANVMVAENVSTLPFCSVRAHQPGKSGCERDQISCDTLTLNAE